MASDSSATSKAQSHQPEVLAVRVDLYLAVKKWDLAADIARALAEAHLGEAHWWVHWAFALREEVKVIEAKAVALRGLERHPDEATLHFNLACYLSLLGETRDAAGALRKAVELDREFQALGVDDPDLTAMWDAFGK